MCEPLSALLLATGASAAASRILAPKLPDVPDQAAIEAEADRKANEQALARKRRMRQNSLLATGGQGLLEPATTAAPAPKATLGA